MYYLVTIKHLSSGSIDRAITPYEDGDVALRKFHEAFNTIGGGPTSITAILIKEVVNNIVNDNQEIISTQISNINIIKQETWSQKIEIIPIYMTE